MKRIILVLVTIFALSLPSFAAEQLSPQQLAALVASAKMMVEHERIANYYRCGSELRTGVLGRFRYSHSTMNGGLTASAIRVWDSAHQTETWFVS
jgi:hypothetical protein